ncbi:histidine kinase [Streptomyces sp. NPDC059578]|uniref:histidine kinase n=1 Tax=Streptomyces sp. NPDC059578 TaxID=3346874 RepID=UPI0036CEB752
MNVVRRIRPLARAVRGWLTAPEPGLTAPGALPVAGRGPARELLVALAMALLAAGTEELLDASALSMAATAAGAFVLWLLRRRLPATVLVVMGVLGALFGGFAVMESFIAWSAGRRIAVAGRALAAFGLSYVLYIAVGIADLGIWSLRSPVALLMLGTLAYVATVVVPGLAGRYWSQRRTLLHALHDRNAQLLWEREMIAGQARLLERQRIAQDMHDSLGHQLALISVHTGALEVDPGLTPRQREAVGVLRNASVTAMHELREVVGILRDGIAGPPVDGAGPAARGIAGLDALVADAQRAGSTVRLRRAGEERPVAAAVGHAAYRIVQEALTNAFKHAPGAAIDVALRYEPDSLVVEVVSDRAAQQPADEVVSGGQGLTGLRERARLVGGIVHAGPADAGGFRVAGVLPYGTAEPAGPSPAPADVPLGGPPPPGVQGSAPGPFGPPSGRPAAPWPGGGGPPAGAPGGWSPQPVRRVSGFGLGCGISVAVVVAGLAVVVLGGILLFRSATEEMVDRSTYEAIRIGTSEHIVRDRLPSGDGFLHTGLDGKKEAPAEPAGATCLTLVSSETSSSWDTEAVFRFCFKDGRLIEKKSFEVTL